MRFGHIIVFLLLLGLVLYSCTPNSKPSIEWLSNSRVAKNIQNSSVLYYNRSPFLISNAILCGQNCIGIVGANNHIVMINHEGTPRILSGEFPNFQTAVPSMSQSFVACSATDNVYVLDNQSRVNSVIGLRPLFDKRFIAERVVSSLRSTPIDIVSLNNISWLAYSPYIGVFAFNNTGSILYRIQCSNLDRLSPLPPYQMQMCIGNEDRVLLATCYAGKTCLYRLEVFRLDHKAIRGHLSLGEFDSLAQALVLSNNTACIGIDNKIIFINFKLQELARYSTPSPIVYIGKHNSEESIIICTDGKVYSANDVRGIKFLMQLSLLNNPTTAHYLVSDNYLLVFENNDMQVIYLDGSPKRHFPLPGYITKPLMTVNREELILNSDGLLVKLELAG